MSSIEITNVPNEYSNVRPYEVGRTVVLNGFILECTTAITTPENYDFTKWKMADPPTNTVTSLVSADDITQILVGVDNELFDTGGGLMAHYTFDTPNIVRVEFIAFAATTNETDIGLANSFTLIFKKSSDGLTRQSIIPLTKLDLETDLFMGIRVHDSSITFLTVPFPVQVMGASTAEIMALYLGLGSRISGGEISARAADLSIQKAASILVASGKNLENFANPHIVEGNIADPLLAANFFKLHLDNNDELVFDSSTPGFLTPNMVVNSSGNLVSISPGGNWTNLVVVEIVNFVTNGAILEKLTNIVVNYTHTNEGTQAGALANVFSDLEVVLPHLAIGGVITQVLTVKGNITDLLAATTADEFLRTMMQQ